MWVLPIAACAQEPVRLSKWGEIVIRQHVAGTPWFGLDVVTGGHTQSVPWVAGLHHQGWAAWQRHSVSAGQRMAVGALAADWLVHVGVDRWPQMRQTDPWVSVDARFSQVVKGSGRFTVDVGWHSQGGLERLLTWSTSRCPPNADGLLGCPQLIWSQQGQWGSDGIPAQRGWKICACGVVGVLGCRCLSVARGGCWKWDGRGPQALPCLLWKTPQGSSTVLVVGSPGNMGGVWPEANAAL